MPANTSKRGLRILATLKALEKRTDPNEGIPIAALRKAIADYLSEFTGKTEKAPDRRTVYSDIETLIKAGYRIDRLGKKPRLKYAMGTNFEAWELRFLADAARTSRSLTECQGDRIVEKLKALAPDRAEEMLERRLQVQQQCHTGSFEQTAYKLEVIEEALSAGCKISYKQEERSADGTKTVKPERDTGNAIRTADPLEYIYSAEGYYYLIVLDQSSGSFTKTPRIDRMADIKAILTSRSTPISEETRDSILEMYRNSFGMFESLSPVDTTLEMSDYHVKSVIDRFGENTLFLPFGKGKSRATVRVNLSNVFYGWVAQFAGEVVIASPNYAVTGMSRFLNSNMKNYPAVSENQPQA